jgi:hypothetical protein
MPQTAAPIKSARRPLWRRRPSFGRTRSADSQAQLGRKGIETW